MTIKVVEQHLRHTLLDSKNEHTRYEVYKDLLSGGFSGLKMRTDYAHPMSFHQVINIERVYDPTLCGYDPLARFSHKGDGRFCFELYPMAKEDFEEEYPEFDISNLSFKRDFAGFNWSYLNDVARILIVAEYYEKVKEKKRIVQVSGQNGQPPEVMTERKYKKMLAEWGDLAAPPEIIGKPRDTELDTITRYRVIENQIIKVDETDFSMLPLIFVDGNSVLIKTPKNGNVRQVTRPYVYHAQSAQRLKNYAGIALANEIENTVQHKFIIKKEALPKEEEWLQAIKDIQKPSNVIVNAFYEENPDQPIPEPIREIMKIPAPPEALQAFTGADSLIQNILGSYDASLGINDNQLSGVALVEAASQSNAAAMPYIVGYLQGYQRAAQIYVDLMPKYFTTPRTLPLLDDEGRRSSIMINQNEGMDMFYDSNALNVTVRAGASFQVQKSRTIVMVKEMMGMSPLFAQFIAEKGLNFVLDNMEGKGIEQLKTLVDGWLKEYQQQKEMAMQQQKQEMQNNPIVMKNKIEMAKVQQKSVGEAQELKYKTMDSQLKHQASMVKSFAESMKAQVELAMKQIDSRKVHALATIDHAHRHAKDIAAHHHAKETLKKQERHQTHGE